MEDRQNQITEFENAFDDLVTELFVIQDMPMIRAYFQDYTIAKAIEDILKR